MDLDVAAMEHGYARPALKEFAKRKSAEREATRDFELCVLAIRG